MSPSPPTFSTAQGPISAADRKAESSLLVEIREAFEHELRARTGRVPTAQQPVVQTEDRHDRLVTAQRRVQRRVIVQSQVTAEPDQGRHDRVLLASAFLIATDPAGA